MVAGGGVALIRASNHQGPERRQCRSGRGHLHRVARHGRTARQIVGNAGDEASVVLDKILQQSGNYGYNAATGEYGDMVEMGILDPTKVTRSALQNAASVAALLITTEAMIAELPKKDSGGGMGGMGGMGDMGGMGGMGGMM